MKSFLRFLFALALAVTVHAALPTVVVPIQGGKLTGALDVNSMAFNHTGSVYFGTSNDVTLARTAANTLTLTGNLGVTGNLTLLGNLAATGTLSTASLTSSNLTAGRVVFAGTAGLLSDDADLTFDTDTLTATKATIGGISHSSNIVTSTAGQNLVFALGTGGTALTLTNSTKAATFTGNVTASSTGTHTFGTTNTVTMAAGVLTALGDASSGRIVKIQENSGALTFYGDAGGWTLGNLFRGSAGTARAFIGAVGGADALTYLLLGDGSATPWFRVSSSESVAAGILTVSGLGTSSVAGNFTVADYLRLSGFSSDTTKGLLRWGTGVNSYIYFDGSSVFHRVASVDQLTLSSTTATVAGNLVVSGTAAAVPAIVTIGASGAVAIPTTTGSGLYFDTSGGATKRIFIGDGTGYSLYLSKRLSSTTTNLFTFADTGNFSAAGSVTVGSGLSLTASNAGVELGNPDGVSNTPFIDFHSSANVVDYDARIIASGGTSTAGQGTLTINAAYLVASGTLSLGGAASTTDSSYIKLASDGTTGNFINFADVDIGGQGYGVAFLRWTRDGSLGRKLSVYVSTYGGVSTEAATFGYTGDLTLNTSTAATSTASGALQVVGGAGIQGAAWIGTYLNVGSRTGGDATLRGDIRIDQANTTVSGAGGLEFKVDGSGSGYGYRQIADFDGVSSYNFVLQSRSNSASWTTALTSTRLGALTLGSASSITAASATDLTLAAGGSGANVIVNVASSSAADPQSNVFRVVASTNQLNFGVNTAGSGYAFLQAVKTGSTWTPLVLQPASSNVLIGTTTDVAGSGGLSVAGAAYIGANLQVTGSNSGTTVPALGTDAGRFRILNGGAYGLLADVLTNGNTYLQAGRVDATATAYNILVNPLGGNVLIGTSTDDATNKLQVNGGGSFASKVTVTGGVSGGGVSSGYAQFGATATTGAEIIGYGSSYDVTLYNRSGSAAFVVLADSVNTRAAGNFATAGDLLVSGASSTSLPAQTGAGLFFDTSGGAAKRLFFADGTGYTLYFSKRILSTTTDLFTFADTGAFTASGAISLGSVLSWSAGGDTVSATLASGRLTFSGGSANRSFRFVGGNGPQVNIDANANTTIAGTLVAGVAGSSNNILYGTGRVLTLATEAVGETSLLRFKDGVANKFSVGYNQPTGTDYLIFYDDVNSAYIGQWSATNFNVLTTLTVTGTGTSSFAGGLKVAKAGKTASYTLTGSDYFISFSGSTAAQSLTLPAVSGTSGQVYVIKNTASVTVNVVTTAAANELFTTSATNTITLNVGDSITLISDGTYWTLN
jgi:hypothetical protein